MHLLDMSNFCLFYSLGSGQAALSGSRVTPFGHLGSSQLCNKSSALGDQRYIVVRTFGGLEASALTKSTFLLICSSTILQSGLPQV